MSVNEGVGYLQEKKNETKKIQQPHDGAKTTLLPEWNLQAVNSMHPTVWQKPAWGAHLCNESKGSPRRTRKQHSLSQDEVGEECHVVLPGSLRRAAEATHHVGVAGGTGQQQEAAEVLGLV